MAISMDRRDAPSAPVTRETGTAVRLWLAGLVALALTIPIVSTALGLYDHIVHWGKLVHGLEGCLVGLLVAVLLFGWRDFEAIDLSDQLAALLTMFSGMFFGVMWKIVEFVLDWVRYSDLQKSNSDTMTDFLWNDLGVVIATLLGLRLYCHALNAGQRREIGQTARWLVDGPSRVLDRHGYLVTILVAALVAAACGMLWFAGRPLPGLAID